MDYIMIASDGIFDKISNVDLNNAVWAMADRHKHNKDISVHKICGLISDEVILNGAKEKSLDNMSVVFVAFKGFKEYIEKARE